MAPMLGVGGGGREKVSGLRGRVGGVEREL